MDGHPRQNPAYRPATEKAPMNGAFSFGQFSVGTAVGLGVASPHHECDRTRMSSPETDAVHLVTFVVPGSSAEPMDVKVAHSGLRMVLVSRESVGLLDESWRVLGIYFLLGGADDPDRYRAYVGEVGRSTLVQRIK